jgi:hypothetical protein
MPDETPMKTPNDMPDETSMKTPNDMPDETSNDIHTYFKVIPGQRLVIPGKVKGRQMICLMKPQ